MSSSQVGQDLFTGLLMLIVLYMAAYAIYLYLRQLRVRRREKKGIRKGGIPHVEIYFCERCPGLKRFFCIIACPPVSKYLAELETTSFREKVKDIRNG